MGSTKKHKDSHKKKRKRERSRSKEPKDKHRHKHKKNKRSREERSPSISLSDVSDVEETSETFANKNSYEDEKASYYEYSLPEVRKVNYYPPVFQQQPQPAVVPASTYSNSDKFGEVARSGNDISMSIEESNRIRAKLGLKPLKEDKKHVSNDEKEYKAHEEIHKPPENISDRLQVEKLREKIAAQREKRLQNAKLKKVKTLGDDGDDSAAAWVKKFRKNEAERIEAEKRNKMLEELDAQFGVVDLVEEEIKENKKKSYASAHLSGIRVQHDVGRFDEGRSTILTLKDSDVLAGDEDTLVNVNLVDTERVELNLKRKKTKINDMEYDAPEVDDEGNIVQQTLLEKYDDDVQAQAKSFRIGLGGEGARLEDLKPKMSKFNKLRKLTSLETPESQLATEYLTAEEVSFKKNKKKNKKSKKLRADDLKPVSGEHWGSRDNRKTREPAEFEFETGEKNQEKVKSLKELTQEDDEEANVINIDDIDSGEGSGEDMALENDAIEFELQEAISRSRRAKQLAARKLDQENSLENFVQTNKQKTDLGSMTLNLTDEFCRSLGEIPTYGQSGNRAAEEQARLHANKSSKEKEVKEVYENDTGTWEEVEIDNAYVEISEDKNAAPILDAEPDTQIGVGNALKLAMQKGYLDKESNKKAGNALQHLQAINYSIEDKSAADDERKTTYRHHDRYSGPIMDFKEKDAYKPDIKLDYTDDEGRLLCPKEAFRYLSHKFHGKGSGKNKLEKRMKKWSDEILLKNMGSNDTPLQTLEKQMEKQREVGCAYLVLSGSMSTETMEMKK